MESSVHPSVDFFLGATTPAGFKGYFAPLRREPGMQLVLLKSGPGCGKSTLMKRLARAAQEKGEPIQRIHCASDPDSLDGVVFLRQKRAIIDATAPHVVEPEAPGADERVLSLYHTIDADALHSHKDEVTALFARNQLLRSRAARYVASAGSLLLDSRRAEACSANFEKVRRYVKRLCTRLLPRTEEMGSEELRLLSAITPKGEVFYQGTVQALADRCILFRDDYGAVSRLLLELIRAETLARGYHIITCPCAMHPEDKIDHIIIPSLRLAFLTDNRWHPVRLSAAQTVRCSRFVDRENLSACRARLRFNERAAAELLEQVIVKLPHLRVTGIAPHPGIAHIKDIVQPGYTAGLVEQGDTLRPSAHIAVHTVVPDVKTRTGSRIRTLGVDHQLVGKAVLIQPGCRSQIIRPVFPIPGQTVCRALGKGKVFFGFAWHSVPPFNLVVNKKASGLFRSLAYGIYGVLFVSCGKLFCHLQ